MCMVMVYEPEPVARGRGLKLASQIDENKAVSEWCQTGLKSQCHVCEFLSTYLELDLTPL